MSSRLILACAGAAVALTACGAASTGPVPIGAGLSGPRGWHATVYARGLTHVSALAYDGQGRLWATTSGATTHGSDGIYVVSRAGAAPRKVAGGITASLGLVWVGDRLIVSS